MRLSLSVLQQLVVGTADDEAETIRVSTVSHGYVRFAEQTDSQYQ